MIKIYYILVLVFVFAKGNVLCKNEAEKPQLSNDSNDFQSSGGIKKLPQALPSTLPFLFAKTNCEHSVKQSANASESHNSQVDSKVQSQSLTKSNNVDEKPQKISTPALPALVSKSTLASSSVVQESNDKPDSPQAISIPALQKPHRAHEKPTTLNVTPPKITKNVTENKKLAATPKSGLKIAGDHNSPDFKGPQIIGQTTPIPGESSSAKSIPLEECTVCCSLDEAPPNCSECCEDTEPYSLPINVLKSLS